MHIDMHKRQISWVDCLTDRKSRKIANCLIVVVYVLLTFEISGLSQLLPEAFPLMSSVVNRKAFEMFISYMGHVFSFVSCCDTNLTNANIGINWYKLGPKHLQTCPFGCYCGTHLLPRILTSLFHVSPYHCEHH